MAALSSTTDPSTGLPVEWIKEDELADMINMHPKILRKALRYLEQVWTSCVIKLLTLSHNHHGVQSTLH